jgi:hypothetical protein
MRKSPPLRTFDSFTMLVRAAQQDVGDIDK